MARPACASWRRSLQLRVGVSTLRCQPVRGRCVLGHAPGRPRSDRHAAGQADAASQVASARPTARARARAASTPRPRAARPGRASCNGARPGSRTPRDGRAPTAAARSGRCSPSRRSAADSRASPRACRSIVPLACGASVAGGAPRRAVRATGRPTRAVDVPALIVGAAGAAPATGDLRALLPVPARPRSSETLGLVQQHAAASPGWSLVLLVAASPGIVTRQVVRPVRRRRADRRAARRPATSTSACPVHGEDDLARLGESFNEMAGSLQRADPAAGGARRGCSGGSPPTSRTSCARRSPPSGWPPTCSTPPATTARPRCARPPSCCSHRAGPVRGAARRPAGDQPATTPASPSWSPSASTCAASSRRVVERVRGLAERAGTAARAAICRPAGAAPRSTRAGSSGSCATWSATRSTTARASRCASRSAADEHAVAVAVRDHGVGLRPGEASAGVQPLLAGRPVPRPRHTGGTGLGLSIALEDARLHGGWLQAWGEPGQGAVFRLTLPRSERRRLDSSPLPLGPEPDTARRVGTSVPTPPLGWAPVGDGVPGRGAR